MQRWADDDLRSLNGQIEFVLRNALGEKRRMKWRGGLPPVTERGPLDGEG